MKMFSVLLFVLSNTAFAAYLPVTPLQQTVYYEVETPVLYQFFVTGFAKWNLALDNYYTLVSADTDHPAQLIVDTDDTIVPSYAMALTQLNFPTGDGRVFIHFATQWAIPASITETAMLHEVGHALGMEHLGEPTAIMYYRVQPTKPPVLTELDVAMIRLIYHLNPLVLSESLSAKKYTKMHAKRTYAFYFNYSQLVYWNFGDGTTTTLSGKTPVIHKFPFKGTYTVTATYLGQTSSIDVKVK